MDDQRRLHWFIAMEFDLVNYSDVEEAVVVDPLLLNYGQPENQTNLLNQIAEFTEEPSMSLEDEFEIEPKTTWVEDEVIIYEDPAGNTFEAPVVETHDKIRTVEPVDDTFEEVIVVEDIITYDESDEEYISRVTFTEEEPKVEPEKLSLDDILIRIPNEEKAEEVKPTETKVVDDFDFNFDDEPKNDLGGEFFL